MKAAFAKLSPYINYVMFVLALWLIRDLLKFYALKAPQQADGAPALMVGLLVGPCLFLFGRLVLSQAREDIARLRRVRT